jgi:hypothetical protein
VKAYAEVIIPTILSPEPICCLYQRSTLDGWNTYDNAAVIGGGISFPADYEKILKPGRQIEGRCGILKYQYKDPLGNDAFLGYIFAKADLSILAGFVNVRFVYVCTYCSPKDPMVPAYVGFVVTDPLERTRLKSMEVCSLKGDDIYGYPDRFFFDARFHTDTFDMRTHVLTEDEKAGSCAQSSTAMLLDFEVIAIRFTLHEKTSGAQFSSHSWPIKAGSKTADNLIDNFQAQVRKGTKWSIHTKNSNGL